MCLSRRCVHVGSSRGRAPRHLADAAAPLQVASLRKYAKWAGLDIVASSSKEELTTAVAKHWASQVGCCPLPARHVVVAAPTYEAAAWARRLHLALLCAHSCTWGCCVLLVFLHLPHPVPGIEGQLTRARPIPACGQVHVLGHDGQGNHTQQSGHHVSKCNAGMLQVLGENEVLHNLVTAFQARQTGANGGGAGMNR